MRVSGPRFEKLRQLMRRHFSSGIKNKDKYKDEDKDKEGLPSQREVFFCN